MKALTIEEFKELLKFTFQSGQVSGRYEKSNAWMREQMGVTDIFHRDFEGWYKSEIENGNRIKTK